MILQSVYRLSTLIYLMSNENLIRDTVPTIYSFSHAQFYMDSNVCGSQVFVWTPKEPGHLKD